jgi:hypothetical protein
MQFVCLVSISSRICRKARLPLSTGMGVFEFVKVWDVFNRINRAYPVDADTPYM